MAAHNIIIVVPTWIVWLTFVAFIDIEEVQNP